MYVHSSLKREAISLQDEMPFETSKEYRLKQRFNMTSHEAFFESFKQRCMFNAIVRPCELCITSADFHLP